MNTVMLEPKSKLVNVIPTKENVDYDRIYKYNSYNSTKAFNFICGNRTNLKSSPTIYKQIKKGEYGAKFIPEIWVDINTMGIVDGQNRYDAFKKAWEEGIDAVLEVRYVDVPEEYMQKLIKVLQNGKKWGVPDYIDSAIALGNEACITMRDWGNAHELCVGTKGDFNESYTMAFLYGKRKTTEIKNKTITLSQKEIDNGERIYNDVVRLIDALGYRKGAWLEPFIQAWYSIRENNALSLSIDIMGMDFICEYIPNEMYGFQTATQKDLWFNKFNEALNNISAQYIRTR